METNLKNLLTFFDLTKRKFDENKMAKKLLDSPINTTDPAFSGIYTTKNTVLFELVGIDFRSMIKNDIPLLVLDDEDIEYFKNKYLAKLQEELTMKSIEVEEAIKDYK